jgi:hypothetical protein
VFGGKTFTAILESVDFVRKRRSANDITSRNWAGRVTKLAEEDVGSSKR